MALELNYEHELGFTMNGMYAKIANLSLENEDNNEGITVYYTCLLYTSPSPRDVEESRMPSSA